ncbi:hypothetical protein ACOMHN_049592 [Nucella lapillus]
MQKLNASCVPSRKPSDLPPFPTSSKKCTKFLLDYRTTPHITTGVSSALFGGTLRTKLPQLPAQRHDADHNMRSRDAQQKASMKRYADSKACIKPSSITVGDAVLLKNPQHSNADTLYQPAPLVVISKNGSMVTAQRGQQTVTRNSSFYKKFPQQPSTTETETDPTSELDEDEAKKTAPPDRPHAHTTPSNHSLMSVDSYTCD